MKNHYFKAIIVSIVLFTSCAKEVAISDREYAIHTIKNTLGDKVENIFYSSEGGENAPIIDIKDFPNFVKSISAKKRYVSKKIELVDNYLIKSSAIKSFDEYEDDVVGGAKLAGYYHVQFDPSSPLNKDLGGFYTLHLYFNIDANGRVIGSPTISYTGFGIFSWQQVNISTISFNPNSNTSQFTITGINTYGAQVGGMTIGWSSMANFQISVNMNEMSTKQVILIEQN